MLRCLLLKLKLRICIVCRFSFCCLVMGKGFCGVISVCFVCFFIVWLSREGSYDLRLVNRLFSCVLVIFGLKIFSSVL